jgi:maleate isomerase
MDQLAWRAKIGLIVVSSGIVPEARYARVALPGVGFFASRMLLPIGGGLRGLAEMERSAARAAEELASAQVDAIAYCCTVSGALRGIEADREFCREMEERLGIPTTSTMLAAVEALQHLGLNRVVVTSPYPHSYHEPERAYLESAGIQPIAMRGMGLTEGWEFAAVLPEEIYRFSLDAWDDRADGLFISCMNFDAMPAAEALEDHLQKPVVTSHSATLWRALGLAGIEDPVPGCGRLLREPRHVAQPGATAGRRG